MYFVFLFSCIIELARGTAAPPNPRIIMALIAETAVAQTAVVQTMLGDDEETETRVATRQEKAEVVLARLPGGTIQKPKDALSFVKDITYKKVGGQQLTGVCIF